MSPPSERLIAFIPDLMAAVRVEAAARAAGLRVEAVPAVDWAAAVAAGAPGAVVDLTAADAAAALALAIAAGIPSLAYGPHVDAAALEAAREAGAKDCLSRGKFLSDPGTALRRLLDPGP